jgi:hypothetical protein
LLPGSFPPTTSDAQWKRAEVRVVRKLRRPMQGAAWVLEDCKTEGSRRVIPLVPVAVEALIRHRDRQAVERLVAAGYRYHGFVFADATLTLALFHFRYGDTRGRPSGLDGAL